MFKKILFVSLIFVVIISCQRKKESIEEAYLNEIEKEYNTLTNIDTNTAIIEAETDTILINPPYAEPSMNQPAGTTTTKRPTDKTSLSSPQVSRPSESKTEPIRQDTAGTYSPTIKSAPKKATIYTFYSPWTSKNDPLIIKEIRVMIANKEYVKAKNYIDRLDFNNLPSDVDLGQLYQFKGIINYFLAKNDKNAIKTANEAFKKVEASTKIEKFKPLSLLWNGMLYQTYSTSEEELNEAISLFDRIIEEYPRTRFANDAIFYKALTLKKMGRPENEYIDLFLSIKRGGFADTLIYSQVINDYVPAGPLVDKAMVK